MTDNGINPINARLMPIKPLEGLDPGSRATTDMTTNGGTGFVDALRGQLDQMIELQNEAEHVQQAFIAGEVESIDQVVLAVQKADLALNFALELRNKVIEAYQEISRMQI